MSGEMPFNGYMPLSKLLDWLNEEYDMNGDVWVQVSGTIQKHNPVHFAGENVAVIEPKRLPETDW